MNPDQVIQNALVYNGLGEPPVRRDVFLSRDKILAVVPHGSCSTAGCTVIPADGLSLAPGFIDVHAHSDLTLLAAPEAFGKISQGITTEISGNCGQSFFPVTDCNREHLTRQTAQYGVSLDWTDFKSYRQALERVTPALNYNCLAGHGTLRAAVLGYENRQASPRDLERMKNFLAESFRAGCPGMSTGLIYVPGNFATKEELLQIFSVLKEYDAVYATHLRSEGNRILDALDEAIFLASAGSGRLEISHLKTAKKENWHKLDAVIEKIESARAKGLKVTADRYPYLYSQTSLSVILPDEPYGAMTDVAIQKALSASPEECECCRRILEQETRWDHTILSFTSLPEYEKLLGCSLAECGQATGMTPAAFTMDVLRRDASRAQGAFGGLNPDNMKRILAKSWVCCGTDENARPADYSLGRSHPRGFGSMPKFLHLVSAETNLSEAIRKVTSLPAFIFSLPRRGQIREGFYADLVLFDEAEFTDTADFARPHSPAAGIRCVWVNGVMSYVPGKAIRRAGRFVFRME